MKKLITTIMLAIFLVSIFVILASALTIRNVETAPSEIKPGDNAEIKITLENDGKNDIKDVSVKLNLDNIPIAPYDSSNEKTIDKIKEDDSEIFEFKIIALNNAKSGIYKIPIEIQYTEEPEIKKIAGLISVTINSVPEIDVQLEDGALLRGSQNALVLKIVNKGLSDIKFLELEVAEGTSYSLLSSKKVYIGELTSDDFETVELKIYFKESSSSLVNLPASLEYKDIANRQYTKQYNLQLKTYTKKEALQLGLIKQSKIGLYFGIIIIVLILWFIYRKIKKRRRAKKARQEAA